jgi:hypothetical protein
MATEECPNCHRAVEETDARFCLYCGQELGIFRRRPGETAREPATPEPLAPNPPSDDALHWVKEAFAGAPIDSVGPQSPAAPAAPPSQASTSVPAGFRRRRLWWPWAIAVLVVLAGIGAGVYFLIGSPVGSPEAGVQGGMWVVFQAESTAGNPLTSDKMDQAILIIKNRLKGMGVAKAEVQHQGSDEINVRLPVIENPAEALQVIGKTAVLEFFDVKQFGTGYSSEADALKAAGVTSPDELPAGTEMVHWPAAADSPTGSDQWFVVTSPPPVSGSMLKSAAAAHDETTGQPKVTVDFDSQGATIFEGLTNKMAETGRITGEAQRLAVVLDGEVRSAPPVLVQVSNGVAEITGKFTVSETKNLALVLDTGSLPMKLVPVWQGTSPPPATAATGSGDSNLETNVSAPTHRALFVADPEEGSASGDHRMSELSPRR